MICSFDKVKTRALLQNVRFQEHSENKALVLLFANYQTKESTVLLGPSGSVISYRKSFFFIEMAAILCLSVIVCTSVAVW